MFPAPGKGDAVGAGATPVVNVPLAVGAGVPLEMTVATVVGGGGGGAVLNGMAEVGI